MPAILPTRKISNYTIVRAGIADFDEMRHIIRIVDRLLCNREGQSEKLITFVTDTSGHDMRYAIDSHKLQSELGWDPSLQFEESIEKRVRWYLDNQERMDSLSSEEHQKFYEEKS